MRSRQEGAWPWHELSWCENWKLRCYVSEDGLKNSDTRESEKIKAWGGDTVLTLTSNKEDTFGFKLIESLNVDVLKVVYGDDNVSGTLATGITIESNAKELDYHAWVIDMILEDGVLKRIVIPSAKVSEIGEITYKHNEAIGYDVTIEAESDASGNTHYE